MADLKYKEVHSHESYGPISLGVKIQVATGNVELSEDDTWAIRRVGDQVMKIIHTAMVKADPEAKRHGEEETRDLLACFGDVKITHVELPNGYCSQPCCVLKPWLKVATYKGTIVIGWRKRVISIDWTESNIKEKAQELFPDEDVTKSDNSIHAWGYEKAKAYLGKLLA
jgi:hypothetical protein